MAEEMRDHGNRLGGLREVGPASCCVWMTMQVVETGGNDPPVDAISFWN